MYLVSTFLYSFDLELVISEMERVGLAREKLMAIPLQPFKRSGSIGDILEEEKGSLFDLAMVMGTIFMLLGVIYGYVLTWGPIIWGLIGLLFGGFIGFMLQVRLIKRKNKDRQIVRQVILMIHVDNKEEAMRVEMILEKYYPTGWARITNNAT